MMRTAVATTLILLAGVGCAGVQPRERGDDTAEVALTPDPQALPSITICSIEGERVYFEISNDTDRGFLYEVHPEGGPWASAQYYGSGDWSSCSFWFCGVGTPQAIIAPGQTIASSVPNKCDYRIERLAIGFKADPEDELWRSAAAPAIGWVPNKPVPTGDGAGRR